MKPGDDVTDSELIDSLRVHRFEPGDKLVLKSSQRMSQAMMEGLRETLQQWAGIPLTDVLVLGDGIELEVVRGLPLKEAV